MRNWSVEILHPSTSYSHSYISEHLSLVYNESKFLATAGALYVPAGLSLDCSTIIFETIFSHLQYWLILPLYCLKGKHYCLRDKHYCLNGKHYCWICNHFCLLKPQRNCLPQTQAVSEPVNNSFSVMSS